MPDYKAKSDQGKTDWSLLPWKSIEKAAEIMTHMAWPRGVTCQGVIFATGRPCNGT
jgi:hypothetical protein